VSSITISRQAEEAILKASSDPAAEGVRRRHGDVPLLLWSRKSYFVANSGERTEFGPRFYLYWTNGVEIEKSNYFVTRVSEDIQVALSPGELFREGSHRIDLQDGKLALSE
jgi:hypothetical protein